MEISQRPDQRRTLLNTNVPMYKHNGFWFFEQMITTDLLESIRNLDVRSDDILVASFAKSGTTWTQEIVWQILTQANVKLPNSEGNMESRFPFLEFRDPQSISAPTLEDIVTRDSPRLMKTHLPHNCIPQGFTKGIGKVIYIAREPKDVSVSLYNFLRAVAFIQYKGTFEQLVDDFLKGEDTNNQVFKHDLVVGGPWIDHIASFWEQGSSSNNMLLLTYEQLQQDGLNTIRKIAELLEVPLTAEQLSTVHEQCSFKSMKDNPQTNYVWSEEAGMICNEVSKFMRKGVVGDWVNYLTPEKATAFDKVFERQLRQVGLTFT